MIKVDKYVFEHFVNIPINRSHACRKKRPFSTVPRTVTMARKNRDR